MAKTKTKAEKNNKGDKSEKKGKVKKRSHKATGPMMPQMFSGLNDKRMKSGGGKFADRTEYKTGETVTVQFLTGIAGFLEIDQHQFRDDGKWRYIPCGGDGCPLCADDDDEVSKTHYRFFANVYNHDTKRVEVLEGPKSLSALLSTRFKSGGKKNPGKAAEIFMSRVWDITKMKTSPVTYDVDRGEGKVKSIKGMKEWDLKANVIAQFQNYFPEAELSDAASLSAKEDDEAETALDDVIFTEKALLKLAKKNKAELQKIANNFGIKAKGKTPEEVVEKILKKQG